MSQDSIIFQRKDFNDLPKIQALNEENKQNTQANKRSAAITILALSAMGIAVAAVGAYLLVSCGGGIHPFYLFAPGVAISAVGVGVGAGGSALVLGLMLRNLQKNRALLNEDMTTDQNIKTLMKALADSAVELRTVSSVLKQMRSEDVGKLLNVGELFLRLNAKENLEEGEVKILKAMGQNVLKIEKYSSLFMAFKPEYLDQLLASISKEDWSKLSDLNTSRIIIHYANAAYFQKEKHSKVQAEVLELVASDPQKLIAIKDLNPDFTTAMLELFKDDSQDVIFTLTKRYIASIFENETYSLDQGQEKVCYELFSKFTRSVQYFKDEYIKNGQYKNFVDFYVNYELQNAQDLQKYIVDLPEKLFNDYVLKHFHPQFPAPPTDLENRLLIAISKSPTVLSAVDSLNLTFVEKLLQLITPERQDSDESREVIVKLILRLGEDTPEKHDSLFARFPKALADIINSADAKQTKYELKITEFFKAMSENDQPGFLSSLKKGVDTLIDNLLSRVYYAKKDGKYKTPSQEVAEALAHFPQQVAESWKSIGVKPYLDFETKYQLFLLMSGEGKEVFLQTLNTNTKANAFVQNYLTAAIPEEKEIPYKQFAQYPTALVSILFGKDKTLRNQLFTSLDKYLDAMSQENQEKFYSELEKKTEEQAFWKKLVKSDFKKKIVRQYLSHLNKKFTSDQRSATKLLSDSKLVKSLYDQPKFAADLINQEKFNNEFVFALLEKGGEKMKDVIKCLNKENYFSYLSALKTFAKEQTENRAITVSRKQLMHYFKKDTKYKDRKGTDWREFEAIAIQGSFRNRKKQLTP